MREVWNPYKDKFTSGVLHMQEREFSVVVSLDTGAWIPNDRLCLNAGHAVCQLSRPETFVANMLLLNPELIVRGSGVTIWSKIDFVVDFRNLLFGCDFDLSFSQGYSLMKIFNYEVDFTAKCDT